MAENERDVALSSRVRLARNLADIPFPPMMNDVYAADVVSRVTDAIAQSPDAHTFMLMRMQDIPAPERARMVEKHLISVELMDKQEGAALINAAETLSIMINEEDHIRIQAILPGLRLDDALAAAFMADDAVGEKQRYAYDGDWGFLTSCPTNTGTGMRASVMMHLPALKMSKQLGAYMYQLGKLGMTARGLYGEGSDTAGNLYQISNQITLGRSEEDIVRALASACTQLAERERGARAGLMGVNRVALEDKVFRSWGVFTHARRMSGKEFMELLSDVRLGVNCGLIEDVTVDELDKLMVQLQPAGIQSFARGEITSEEGDILRASKIRDIFEAKG